MNKRQRVFVRSGYQRETSDGQHKTYGIGVPWNIAETLPDGLEFVPELTEFGLLFRPVVDRPPTDLPAWAKGVSP